MANTKSRICGLFCGDTWPIVRSYQDVSLIGLTISQAIYMIKRKAKDADSAAIVTNIITTALGPDGRITDASPSDGTIGMNFVLPPAKTILLKPGREYVWAIKVQDTGGGKYTLESGTVQGERQLIST